MKELIRILSDKEKKSKLLILLFLFVFALLLRFYNLYAVGRTWDESAYVDPGYKYVKFAESGNFSDPSWYHLSDHPPLARYFFGIGAQFDFQGYDAKGQPKLDYDYKFARIPPLIFSSLSVVVVALTGFEFFSTFVGISAGVILAMIPFFLGLSQVATLESFIMFFFTTAVYAFLKFLKQKYDKKLLIIAGVSTGLALLTKQSNILLFPLFFLLYITWYLVGKPKKEKILGPKFWAMAIITVVSGITIFVLWPMPFFHIKDLLEVNGRMWVSNVKLPPPEVFFGKLVLVPKIYYFVMFLITTPVLILALFFLGLRKIDHKPNWIGIAIVLWFLFPFVQSLYPFRQHGVRYIIEIYAPLAILAGLGLESLFSWVKQKEVKYAGLLILVVYLTTILIHISPYYIDYFNEAVGGPKKVYEKQLFQLGWWGEGTKEAVDAIHKDAKKKSTVGLIKNQLLMAPTYPNLTNKIYSDNASYDYIVVNYFNVLREKFDDSKIKKNYRLIYSVMADGAPIVKVYKK